jgi:hypothetical protein
MKAQPAPALEASSRTGRRRRITAVAMSVALVCSGATSCTRTQIALSSTGIAAAVVGTTVGVTLAVQHSHHTLQGCLFSDADGLKFRTSAAKVYTLKGETADVKVGDKLKLHGSKVKMHNGDSGDRVFLVEKVNKDYGPCPASVQTSTSPAR